jgi:peptidyl-prolyl cis-trans isomerase SurA
MIRVLFTALLVAIAWPAAAQEVKIAAVVNDDVISYGDLEARLRLVIGTSNMPDNDTTRQRLAPQILRSLVDEKLELQEAKRLNIKVTDQDIAAALARIEQQNQLPKGGLDAYMREHGLSQDSLADQLTASLAWGKVVRQHAYLASAVSDEEIDDTLARMRTEAGQPQNRVAEIFLTVDDPKRDDEVHRFADQLYDRLRGGANFPAVAHQFSQSATAAVGGDLGWVRASDLGNDLAQIVQRMRPGELAPPVRIGGGYHILYLVDRRSGVSEPEVSLAQIMLPLAPTAGDAEKASASQKVAAIGQTAKSCGEFLKMGRDVAPQTSGDLGRVKVSDLPADLRQIVSGLQVAQATPPVPLRGGIGILMVCNRDEGSAGLPSREDVGEGLAQQRLEVVAQRYLRDLRRQAFVDVRG